MKRFNTTGLCLPEKHYMCDVTTKFNRCKSLIEDGFYFAINFPRQHGKTTMKALLAKEFKKHDDYLVISTSFEGISDESFKSEKNLCRAFLGLLSEEFEYTDLSLSEFFTKQEEAITSFKELERFISKWISSLNKKVILMIDEVDKASNNQVFLSFLGSLRDRYLSSMEKSFSIFHSIVLIGVHDVKTLKLKLRPNENGKLNSPWNIAESLNTKFTFSADEISPMISDYAQEHNFVVDADLIAKKLFYYTSGNPFLISQMCKVIDEQLVSDHQRAWIIDDIDKAYKYVTNLAYTNTNFDDLYKNLENNESLRNLVKRVAVDGDNITFDLGNSTVSIGSTYGILSTSSSGKCDISNKVYEFRVVNYLISRENVNKSFSDLYLESRFTVNGKLNLDLILQKFQLFMKEHNSSKDNKFLEKNGRMLLMSFLRPIINGKGYMFKENVTAEDRKMDLVITYNDERYVIELKIWYGEKYLSDGIEQLCDYLDQYNLETGHLLIYNFNKNKEYKTEIVPNCRKHITAVFV